MRLTMRSRFSTSFCLSGFTGVVAMSCISVMMSCLRLVPIKLSVLMVERSGVLSSLPYCPLFNPFAGSAGKEDLLHVDARHVHLVGLQLSGFHQFLHLGDSYF